MTQEEVQDLVERKVSESKTIEYKREAYDLSGEARKAAPSDKKDEVEGKKDFLLDVTAMANTDGGQIFLGIDEERDGNRKTGYPSAAPGVPMPNFEYWKQQATNLLRDSCEPPLNAISIDPVSGFDRGPVIVIQVPKSWLGPHRVNMGGASYFYMRNPTGNNPMDIGAIRHAFLQSDSAAERLKRFRAERVALISANQGQVELRPTGIRAIIHLLPLESAVEGRLVDLRELFDALPNGDLEGIGDVMRPRRNFDGALGVGGQPPHDYLQVFRDLRMEAVTCAIGDEESIAARRWEVRSVVVVSKNLKLLRRMGILGPVYVGLSLTNTRGKRLASEALFGPTQPFDRDVMLLPETVFDQDSEIDNIDDVRLQMKLPFEVAWQANGYSRSGYLHDGKWTV